MAPRLDLDGKEITPLTICLIGGGGFIGYHLCDKLMSGTPHRVIVIDFSDEKVKDLFRECNSWINWIKFHKYDYSHLASLINKADVTINLGVFCDPENNIKETLHTIHRIIVDVLPVINFCSESKKRLIHFSSSEVYGRTIGSFLPKDDRGLYFSEPHFYILKEDDSPCVFDPIEKQRWSDACGNQLIERQIFGMAAENGLEFTIVRPFNWIGSKMELAPNEIVPRVFASIADDLIKGKKIRLFDDARHFKHTFVHINDAIDAILLMIENPSRANGQIFNVANPTNGITRKQLDEMLIRVYQTYSNPSTIDPNSNNDKSCSKRTPDVTIINRQLGWYPKMYMPETLVFQYLEELLFKRIL